MRLSLIVGLAVIGLQFGCGVDEADVGAQSDLASREDPLYICLSDFYITYYTDASYTTVAGTEQCYCNGRPSRTGFRTDFAVEHYNEECPWLAPKNP